MLFSLIAEPITGLVDTAFVATLGADQLAGLGVGTTVLSSFFWIFNFLAIGTQTEIARSSGQDAQGSLSRLASVALSIAVLCSIPVAVGGFLLSFQLSSWMAATGDLQGYAAEYMRIRWLGAPAMLVTLAGFGTLRGIQDMQTPLKIAVGVNLANVVLDPLLIFGWGPIPAFGIRGAATATVVSQWLGALWILRVLSRTFPLKFRLVWSEVLPLLRIGRDLFIRTGLLTFFLILTTRSATRAGAESGAAHQAIRQVWMLTALFLDSFAIAGQSLVAFFMGSSQAASAKKVARIVLAWSVGTGVVLGLLMLSGQALAIALLVPATAVSVFLPAWKVAALSQPLNSLSFATDGIHWGTGDFAFLRNVVILATGFGALSLLFLNEFNADALFWIWMITAAWIIIRATFGLLRIWPGIGNSPFCTESETNLAQKS